MRSDCLRAPGLRVRDSSTTSSRRGVMHNVDWLLGLADRISARDRRGRCTRPAMQFADGRSRRATEIYHLAAQVAVTTSVEDPAADFSTNADRNLQRARSRARFRQDTRSILFTSTNKVYGSLEGVPVAKSRHNGYEAQRPGFSGVTEQQPLDFHSPYGCSKGAADQYVRDYARIYGMDTVVFRMSCIAGPRQFGNEDQGWVAHFLYSVLQGRPITVCGDGFPGSRCAPRL